MLITAVATCCSSQMSDVFWKLFSRPRQGDALDSQSTCGLHFYLYACVWLGLDGVTSSAPCALPLYVAMKPPFISKTSCEKVLHPLMGESGLLKDLKRRLMMTCQELVQAFPGAKVILTDLDEDRQLFRVVRGLTGP